MEIVSENVRLATVIIEPAIAEGIPRAPEAPTPNTRECSAIYSAADSQVCCDEEHCERDGAEHRGEWHEPQARADLNPKLAQVVQLER